MKRSAYSKQVNNVKIRNICRYIQALVEEIFAMPDVDTEIPFEIRKNVSIFE